MRAPATSPERGWGRGRVWLLVGTLLITLPITLVGVQARQIWLTAGVTTVVLGVAVWLTAGARHQTEVLVRQLTLWGGLWLLLGLALDPAYGGMSKMEANPTYLFGTAGLAVLTLAALTSLADLLGFAANMTLLAENGQNPMIGYVANGMLLLPLLALTTLKDRSERLMPPPWPGFVRGVLLTLVIAYVVRFFTRRRLLWRS
jgi:hypothetical protein